MARHLTFFRPTIEELYTTLFSTCFTLRVQFQDDYNKTSPASVVDITYVFGLSILTFSALVANPKKLLYTVANPARGLLNRGKKRKKQKSGSARPPPPPSPPRLARCSFGEKKKKKKITRRIHISRRYASRRSAGGLGPSRIRTRISTTRQLGQWVSLRKTLRFRLRLQLSQSRCLSLLLAMSGRVFLFLPPRGHAPPPTLRDRLNPTLSL